MIYINAYIYIYIYTYYTCYKHIFNIIYYIKLYYIKSFHVTFMYIYIYTNMANRSVGRDPQAPPFNHQVATSWAPWVPACSPRRRPGNPWALPAAPVAPFSGRLAWRPIHGKIYGKIYGKMMGES